MCMANNNSDVITADLSNHSASRRAASPLALYIHHPCPRPHSKDIGDFGVFFAQAIWDTRSFCLGITSPSVASRVVRAWRCICFSCVSSVVLSAPVISFPVTTTWRLCNASLYKLEFESLPLQHGLLGVLCLRRVSPVRLSSFAWPLATVLGELK
jgi:hypothetical protein